METTNRKRRNKLPGLPIVHRRSAGIDVGSTFHVVAVPASLDSRPLRTLCTFTGALHELAQWLKEVGITTVAMESTGDYWIAVDEMLQSYGLEVLLANARGVKNVSGRKTHVCSRIAPVLFGYNGTRYETLSGTAVLTPWSGYWLAALPGLGGTTATLGWIGR